MKCTKHTHYHLITTYQYVQLTPLNSAQTICSRPGGARSPSTAPGYAYICFCTQSKTYEIIHLRKLYLTIM